MEENNQTQPAAKSTKNNTARNIILAGCGLLTVCCICTFSVGAWLWNSEEFQDAYQEALEEAQTEEVGEATQETDPNPTPETPNLVEQNTKYNSQIQFVAPATAQEFSATEYLQVASQLKESNAFAPGNRMVEMFKNGDGVTLEVPALLSSEPTISAAAGRPALAVGIRGNVVVVIQRAVEVEQPDETCSEITENGHIEEYFPDGTQTTRAFIPGFTAAFRHQFSNIKNIETVSFMACKVDINDSIWVVEIFYENSSDPIEALTSSGASSVEREEFAKMLFDTFDFYSDIEVADIVYNDTYTDIHDFGNYNVEQ